ncbi:Gfo/Idh/MocA family protein [Ornithinibacillus contaminans]|uniref:Gfo/Idh/MocA family protein n=1 Tax=Ornithinibacillus contaminans TaxID=694055 RepID=UPI0009FA5028|nr:Gfo/Idh/MocA family oxidoreductase [Ornithinibacillus contaminans]
MRYSVVGTSWITEMFIHAARKTKQAELVSVYSRNEETARTFATKNSGKQVITNWDELLADESEFVYIASPNKLHYEHVMDCIEKGKHVFCEKPMAYTKAQAEAIFQAAQEKNVFVFEGYRHLFSPNYNVLKEALRKIGQVRGAILPYLQYSSRYDLFKEGTIANVFSRDFAGGALMDLGVYPVSMAIDLFGKPSEVKYSPVLLSNGIDGSGTLVLTYKD